MGPFGAVSGTSVLLRVRRCAVGLPAARPGELCCVCLVRFGAESDGWQAVVLTVDGFSVDTGGGNRRECQSEICIELHVRRASRIARWRRRGIDGMYLCRVMKPAALGAGGLARFETEIALTIRAAWTPRCPCHVV